MNPIRVGIIGARGYVGDELTRLLAAHPDAELACVCSRERDGQRLADHHPDYSGELRYSAPEPQLVADATLDAVLLAMPNGRAGTFVHAIDADGQNPVIIDLSADYRFDADWHYGLPELTRDRMQGRRRISNPGCYATAMQLAITPLLPLLDGPATCFGVSGYSGAGTTPSDRNNPESLRDNLMPYALTGHVHEREVSAQLRHPVQFMPHVAAHFRGLSITASLPLRDASDAETLLQRYADRYAHEPLVQVQRDAPWISHIAGRHGAAIGGVHVTADGRRAVVVSVLDNLLKGAATQAVQNLNLAFGLDEWTGIAMESTDD